MDDCHAVSRRDNYTIPRFRSRYFLPPIRCCPIVPVVFAVLQSDHFFTVAIDYERSQVHVFGRPGVVGGDWKQWDGPMIYSHICRLHGWRVPDDISAIQVHEVNWTGNGYDCGPNSIMVVLHLFKHGLESLGAMDQYAKGCGHMTRLKIYQELKARCKISYEDFQIFGTSAPEQWSSWDAAESWESDYTLSEENKKAVEGALRGGQDASIRKLHDVISACSECRNSGPINGGRRKTPNDDLHGSRERSPYVPENPHADADSEDPRPNSSDDEVRNSGPESRRTGQLRRGRKGVLDWSQLECIRYPRPCPPKDVPLPRGALWLRHDPQFDDYDGGPTREELHAHEDPICNYPLNPFAHPLTKSIWTTFRDYGYRLLSRFPHMIYLGKPTQVEEHVLQNGLPDDYDPSQLYPNVFKDLKLSRSAYPALKTGKYTDVEFMGAQEMLDSVGDEFSWAAHDLWVRGKRDGKYVCLDLERDAVHPEEVPLKPSTDVDSLNWITWQLRTKLTIHLMVTPTVRKTPPIRKSNHMYFNLLVPPTEEEREDRRREWLEKPISLSSCPHTTFAKVAEGVHIYILFPRMIHRDEYSGYRVNIVPLPLQTMFWDQVVLPALKKHLDVASLPYMDFTVEEFQHKTAPKSNPKGADHFSGTSKAVDPSVLEKMIATMRDIIKNDYPGEMLHRFGSFFFVLEAKGIKLSTQEYLGSSGSDPWQRLTQQFPQLNFEYMMDPANGQFIVDVGISINPSTSDPVVGLWRLDCLEASFGAGGFRKGQIHTVNTLARYGAIQAEMQSERMRRTHIIHRSAYPLVYEPTRRKDNQPFFANDGDAYELNERWTDACEVREKIYQGPVQQRSYGVRDEYRVGGFAAKTLLENAETSVRGVQH
jgi:hypothetical protein